ncbi:hypothetical protein F5B19DRAFT_160634 [Rostrohypoxylon terebratum]|nr:hypothetical protein F5B19DRAFT_160634 [Rostrohypoxylon terebratum]
MSADNANHSPCSRKPENSPSNSEMPGHDRSVTSTSADDVLSWAISSPYSPANLQSLPQPRPNDAPRDCPNCFTFRDAFEDLLAAGDGRPLFDLRRLLFAKQFEHFKYSPWGMPVEDWVSSIGRRGLWGAYFPLSLSAKRELSFGLISPWIFQTKEKTFNQPQTFAWSRVPFPRWEFHFPPSDNSWTRYGETPSKHGPETTQQQEPDTEEACYTNAPSRFPRTQVGVQIPLEEPTHTKPGPTWDSDSSASEAAPVSQTIETPDGGKILKTVQQRTYGGGAETTTTTQQFDADGNLVAQSKEASWAWSRTFPADGTSSLNDRGKSEFDAEAPSSSSVSGETSIRGGGKVGGWFWAR